MNPEPALRLPETLVIVSWGGQCYHRPRHPQAAVLSAACWRPRYRTEVMTVSKASECGFTACQRCWPELQAPKVSRRD